jgi:hypothetical protein
MRLAYSKPWKSYEEQLNLLISRGLDVTDRHPKLWSIWNESATTASAATGTRLGSAPVRSFSRRTKRKASGSKARRNDRTRRFQAGGNLRASGPALCLRQAVAHPGDGCPGADRDRTPGRHLAYPGSIGPLRLPTPKFVSRRVQPSARHLDRPDRTSCLAGKAGLVWPIRGSFGPSVTLPPG